MRTFGLIGRDIGYSFSPSYFAQKFDKEEISNAEYKLFDIPDLIRMKDVLKNEKNLKGLNVTIPYKEDIIPYLDEIDNEAAAIGAVNTISVENGKLIGFNTDVYGFQRSLAAVLKSHHERALILGTGGASKAIAYVLNRLGVEYKFVSRNPLENQFSYQDLNEYVFRHFKLIINTTPLGVFPDVSLYPDLHYSFLGAQHLCYDLIYNPEKTKFLEQAESNGASILNGRRMLELQAEKSWQIWNKP